MNSEPGRFLGEALRPYRLWAGVLVVFSLLSAAVDGLSVALVIPILSSLQQSAGVDSLPTLFQPIMRPLTALPFERMLLILVSLLLAAVIVKSAFFATSIHIGHWLTGRITADLRRRAIWQLLTVDVAYLQSRHSGDHLDNIMFNTFNVDFLLRASVQFLVNSVILVVLFGLALAVSWQYTVLTLGSLLILAIFLSPYFHLLKRQGEKQANVRARLAALLAETLNGNIAIRLLAKETLQLARLEEVVDLARQEFQRKQTRTYLVANITEVLGTLVVGLLLVYAAMTRQLSTPGDVTRLLAYLVILVRMLPALKEVSRTRGVIVANYPYLGRVADLLRVDDKPFMADGRREYTTLQSSIRFQSLHFTYPNVAQPALEAIDLTIAKGQTTGLVGASGSGKTTLAQLLIRLFDPQRGVVLIDGVPLPEFRLASLRAAIGIVSQDTFLFDDTVFNNIAFGAVGSVDQAAVFAAARQANAHSFISELPDGYETTLGERGVRLSGGQRQRIAIARTILRDPDILILDEATSALDQRTEQVVRDAISTLLRDRTVIVIAHRASSIEEADQIVVLKDGRIAEIGDSATLLAKPDGEYVRLAAAEAI